jgi:hypothetical protein
MNESTLDLINLGVTAVTFVALVLAIYQLRIANEQTRVLNGVSESLSTRYIGNFPFYLSEITRAIEGAQSSISICCDYPAYGCFSDPEGWLNYRFAIARRAADGVPIEAIYLSEEGRRRFSPEQFGKSKLDAWDLWRAERMYDLEIFFQKKREFLQKLEKVQFLDELEERNRLMINDTFRSASHHEVGTDMPLYFWIIDHRIAFFAFRHSDKIIECGFRTSDKGLIESFEQVQEYFKKFMAPLAGSVMPSVVKSGVG